MKAVFTFFFILSTTTVFAQTKVAIVKLIRGNVDVLTIGKTTRLEVDNWVTEGSVVKTGDKSFVKLIFVDKSQMNVGPNSEMKIETLSGKDSGIIDLIKGKIRAQVTKDYLQMQNKDKSKLFIKTQNAVMGVRGTDFMISTNGATTSTVLFEGEIVFNRLEQKGSYSTSKLEEIVDRGVRIYPGEFSVMDANRTMPTVPSILNIQQIEKLEKNQEFNSERGPSNSSGADEKTKSIVPEGLDGNIVSNNSKTINSEVQIIDSKTSTDAGGFVKGNEVKPANGSFIHIESGVIIPPGDDAILDKNSNTFIPGKDSGKVSEDGNFIPPKNVEITNDGRVLITIKDQAGATKVQQVEKPSPVMTKGNVMLSNMANVIQANPILINTTKVVTNDILNSNFSPTFTDLSNQTQTQKSGVLTGGDPTRILEAPTNLPTRIIVKPEIEK